MPRLRQNNLASSRYIRLTDRIRFIYLALCGLTALMILTDARSNEVAERLRAAVEAALEARNLSARRASIEVVGHDGLIRDIRAGRIPSVDRIEALFDYLGLEAYFGPKRPASAGSVTANHLPGEEAPSGFLTIPWAVAGSRPGSSPIAFSRAWLKEHGLVPDFLTAAMPDEVLLEGHRTDDTVALLDSRTALRKGHGVWCFRSAGKTLVANVTFGGSVTVIHAADPASEPQIIEGPAGRFIDTIGKVVWLGQSVPLKGKID